jgi:predicted dehydrogenase
MTSSPRIVTALVIGAGGRGMTYALFSKLFPERLRIIGVAEPKEFNRNFMVETYGLAPENVATDWHALAERPKFADAVFICTQDAQHAEPAIAFARKGYAILLEKPMAPNEEDCFRIVEAAKEAGVIFGVCHVLRYTSYTQTLKKLVDSGAVGEIVNIQHLEPVGYWHQAHSFVRGNWGNEKRSSFMLLSKSCHDLDWISYMMGDPCKSLSSFGSLKHFKKSEKPAVAGEATRCVACAYETQCPYSAKKIYLGRLERGETGWPVDVLTLEPTVATVLAALETGPYGRCVYECDNDVVDNQVVSMQFANNKTATFTMTAFNQARPRRTRIFGTRGEIYGDGNSIQLFDFLTDELHDIPIEEPVGEDDSAARLGGHGGGDYGLMDHFVAAVAENDPSKVLTGPDISLATHRMVFAAERARLQHCVVDL